VISSEVNRRGNCFRKLSGNRESSLQTREVMKLLLDDWLAEGKEDTWRSASACTFVGSLISLGHEQ
jgi:hypothetical protein